MLWQAYVMQAYVKQVMVALLLLCIFLTVQHPGNMRIRKHPQDEIAAWRMIHCRSPA